MGDYRTTFTGDADDFAAYLDRAISGSSASAQVENGSDQTIGDARMLLRVYERYSMAGGNRVSLAVSILAVGDQLAVSAITSGGSQAVFWKINTWGESTFLDKAIQAIEGYAEARRGQP